MARSKKNSGSRPDKNKSVESSVEETFDEALASDTVSEDVVADESFDETLDDVLTAPEGDADTEKSSSADVDDDASAEEASVEPSETSDEPADDTAISDTAEHDGLSTGDDAEPAADLVTIEGVEQTDHDTPEDETAKTEPDAAPLLPPVAPEAEEKRSSFVPLVLGGLVAGAIGYAIPTFLMPSSDGGSTDRFEALEAQIAAIPAAEMPDLAPITAAQDALRADVDALADRVAALEAAPSSAGPATGASTAPVSTAAPVDDSGLRSDVEALASRADGVEAALGDLTGRVDELENGFGEATGAAASVVAEAEALARQAAQNQIALALQSGAPFAEQVEILGDVPADLAAVADDGVVTQDTLIADFPPLAREALRLARSSESGGGMGSLFRNAFNPRSLEPREGDDPDAVLSRAEAAVRNGDVATALTEMEGLPDAAAAPLADWRARAETRAAALAAADAYLQDG